MAFQIVKVDHLFTCDITTYTPPSCSLDSDVAGEGAGSRGASRDCAPGSARGRAPTSLLSSEARRTSYRAILAQRMKVSTIRVICKKSSAMVCLLGFYQFLERQNRYEVR